MARGRKAAQPARRSRAAAVAGAGPACCRLEGALRIREANERLAQLRAALAAGADTFDLGGVTAIDTAGVQLLLALAQEGTRLQRRLHLRACPALVGEALQTLGVGALLEPLLAQGA